VITWGGAGPSAPPHPCALRSHRPMKRAAPFRGAARSQTAARADLQERIHARLELDPPGNAFLRQSPAPTDGADRASHTPAGLDEPTSPGGVDKLLDTGLRRPVSCRP